MTEARCYTSVASRLTVAVGTTIADRPPPGSRNPLRNVAIVDALIAEFCILAATPLLSLWMTDIRSIYRCISCGGDLRSSNSGMFEKCPGQGRSDQTDV